MKLGTIVILTVLGAALIFGVIRYVTAPSLLAQEELEQKFPVTGGKSYRIGK